MQLMAKCLQPKDLYGEGEKHGSMDCHKASSRVLTSLKFFPGGEEESSHFSHSSILTAASDHLSPSPLSCELLELPFLVGDNTPFW